jgi:serine/threonine protein kinase
MIVENEPDFERRDFMRFSKNAKDLLLKLLEKDPKKRITPKIALQHQFFFENGYSIIQHQ